MPESSKRKSPASSGAHNGPGHRIGGEGRHGIDRAAVKPVLEEVLAEGRLSLSADAKNECHARQTAERAPPDPAGPHPRADPSPPTIFGK